MFRSGGALDLGGLGAMMLGLQPAVLAPARFRQRLTESLAVRGFGAARRGLLRAGGGEIGDGEAGWHGTRTLLEWLLLKAASGPDRIIHHFNGLIFATGCGSLAFPAAEAISAGRLSPIVCPRPPSC
jgi:hypothetical protein